MSDVNFEVGIADLVPKRFSFDKLLEKYNLSGQVPRFFLDPK